MKIKLGVIQVRGSQVDGGRATDSALSIVSAVDSYRYSTGKRVRACHLESARGTANARCSPPEDVLLSPADFSRTCNSRPQSPHDCILLEAVYLCDATSCKVPSNTCCYYRARFTVALCTTCSRAGSQFGRCNGEVFSARRIRIERRDLRVSTRMVVLRPRRPEMLNADSWIQSFLLLR